MKEEPKLEELGRTLTVGIDFEVHLERGIDHGSFNRKFPVEKLKIGDNFSEPMFKCSQIILKELTPDKATVAFGKEVLTTRFGERTNGKWTTGYRIEQYWISYEPVTLLDRTFEKLNEIVKIHANITDKFVINETTEMEQEVLDNLNTLIDKGHTDLYPLKALLWASNNWYTKRIVRAGMYTDILQEGIEKDALGPQNEAAWWWVKKALDANDYEYRLLGDVDIIAPLIQNASDAHNWWAEKIREKIMES